MFKTSLYSPQLGIMLQIEVAFPPGYRNLRGPFSALLLNDAQNQWTWRGGYGGWHTDSIAADLFRKGQIRPVILAGIISPPNRERVFGPPPQGRADRYADFLADTLLPALRRHIPISKNPSEVGIVGASFASNASLFIGMRRPDAIGLVAALSGAPHFGKPLGAILAEHRRLPMRKLYIDCGTRWSYDQPNMDDSTAFNRNLMAIARQRMPKDRFLGLVARGHYHNEEFWRKRIGRVLRFFYGAT